jgi:hypothetical protein
VVTGRGARLVAAFAAAALLAPPVGGAEPTAPTEWEVKAAYLYNFTRFVEWPDQATAPPGSPFVVGIFGADPFGRVLDDTFAGKSAGGRPIVIRRLERAEDAGAVQILFIASAADRDAERALRAAQGRPVLTVGDEREPGGGIVILNFRIRDNRVRFEVNLAPAEEAGLKISSQLLKLALSVERR